MFSIGPAEVTVILIVALIVLGPKKLPEFGRALGEGLRELKRASRSLTDSLVNSDDDLHNTKENTSNADDRLA